MENEKILKHVRHEIKFIIVSRVWHWIVMMNIGETEQKNRKSLKHQCYVVFPRFINVILFVYLFCLCVCIYIYMRERKKKEREYK
jgi:uncharacterized membrane protein